MYMYLNILVFDLLYNFFVFFFKKNFGIEGMCLNFFIWINILNVCYWGGRLVGICCIYLDSIRMFELFRIFKLLIKYC